MSNDLTDGQLAALLISRCNMTINEVLSFITARDEVRAMCLAPVFEPSFATVPAPAAVRTGTLPLGVCYVDEAAQ